jgi:hypothetical protein
MLSCMLIIRALQDFVLQDPNFGLANKDESGRRDSNPRPLAWKANALAS